MLKEFQKFKSLKSDNFLTFMSNYKFLWNFNKQLKQYKTVPLLNSILKKKNKSIRFIFYSLREKKLKMRLIISQILYLNLFLSQLSS